MNEATKFNWKYEFADKHDGYAFESYYFQGPALKYVPKKFAFNNIIVFGMRFAYTFNCDVRVYQLQNNEWINVNTCYSSDCLDYFLERKFKKMGDKND